MALFPMFVDLSGRFCLVLGAGGVACRKIYTLLAAKGAVHVWSKKVCDDILLLASEGRVVIEDAAKPPEPLIARAYLVVCATNDVEFNEKIVGLCQKLHVFVNCAAGENVQGCLDTSEDAKERDTSFIFPSLLVRDTISVGISTFPPVPSLSRSLRQRLEKDIPVWLGIFGKNLYMYRCRLGGFKLDQPGRAAIMGRLTEYGLNHEGKIPEEIFMKFVHEEERV